MMGWASVSCLGGLRWSNMSAARSRASPRQAAMWIGHSARTWDWDCEPSLLAGKGAGPEPAGQGRSRFAVARAGATVDENGHSPFPCDIAARHAPTDFPISQSGPLVVR